MSTSKTSQEFSDLYQTFGSFVGRHVGPDEREIQEMLKGLGLKSLDELVDRTVPKKIRSKRELNLGPGLGESEVIAELREMASQNQIYKSYIGMGYYNCTTPTVIQRNILENPGWYTQYTPYQAEISQGRLEALLNFQTMVSDLTGLPIANASLLDEGTAAAEAMSLCLNVNTHHAGSSKSAAGGVAGRPKFFVSDACHPQTIEVVRTRAEALDIEVLVGDHRKCDFSTKVFGALIQYPATDGSIFEYKPFVDLAHEHKALVVAACDLLALTLLKAPGDFGVDVAVGSTQRFGVPLGFGGPHAAFLATKDDYKRQMPGRLVGVSIDGEGKPALRLALQTREQHIRRAKATSNICTAQVLLAIMASMFAVYHGPEGLKRIARRVRGLTLTLAEGLRRLGYEVSRQPVFDTISVDVADKPLRAILMEAEARRINLRALDERTLGISLDETVKPEDVAELFMVFACGQKVDFTVESLASGLDLSYGEGLERTSPFLLHPVFNSYHSETEMLRYINKLQARDLSLAVSMIPLGSCTMKLNATTEMLPVTWPEFANIHPFVPGDQARGYHELVQRLEGMLAEITGFQAVSMQPNAGSQGEYAGLLVIRKYHEDRGEGHRKICLIPNSAHGTNPASAVMAGLEVVGVETDSEGNINIADLRAKADKYARELACLMVTYPSTHGVFEEGIIEICETIHSHGGQVYMDGANMNAQVGLCRPGDFGADVCHLNLHKTFCIPHGGGGPGMGPIGVKAHLAPYLPSHPVVKVGGERAIGAVSAAPWGSPSILPISYAYIRMMGTRGLRLATEVAILNANYIAHRLGAYYPVLYKGAGGLVAHECIIDLRSLKLTSGVEVVDVAKRLMDYSFHAPTISWPVAGTMMVEPTESESKRELDRFCDAMIAIHGEIMEVAARAPALRENNLLKGAPHTAAAVTADKWERPYSRQQAAFPVPWVREFKFWPPVSRINDPYGDRNLVCSCPTMESYN